MENNKFLNDTLGNRMKKYENTTRNYLTSKACVIIRLDGRAFHTFTKGLKRPFDRILSDTMSETMKLLCNEIQGCIFGYTQSDEISLLITDLDKLDSQAWFGNNLNKLISISASLCTLHFNRIFMDKVSKFSVVANYSDYDYLNTLESKVMKAIFDSRAFNIPIVEATNYFIWRQNDAIKNAITMAASTKFSHKELQGVSTSDRLLKMSSIGLDYNKEYETKYRMGVSCYKELVKEDKPKVFVLDYEMPKITEDRKYFDIKIEHLFYNIDSLTEMASCTVNTNSQDDLFDTLGYYMLNAWYGSLKSEIDKEVSNKQPGKNIHLCKSVDIAHRVVVAPCNSRPETSEIRLVDEPYIRKCQVPVGGTYQPFIKFGTQIDYDGE